MAMRRDLEILLQVSRWLTADGFRHPTTVFLTTGN